MERKFGLLPDLPDERDYIFKATRFAVQEQLPEVVDHRPFLRPLFDQLWLGSCAENTAVTFRHFLQYKDGMPPVDLARLYLYYKDRETMGSVDRDSGSRFRDVMKNLATKGCAPESFFPYIPETFTNKPSDEAEASAGAYKIKEYHRITSFVDLLHALAEGNVVCMGMTICDSFDNIGKDGMFPMPADNESTLGGHGMLACGYMPINGIRHVITANWYGPDWGDMGFCYIPEDYFRKTLHVTDLWTGVSKINYENFSLDQALNTLQTHNKIDSPDLWREVLTAVAAGKFHPALQYLPLFFRKWGADVENQ